MTQEDKQVLLKDLCARFPYGVFIHYHWSREGNTIDEDRELDFSDVETLKYDIENPQNDWCEISWKPYLRPMSSMTEEEWKEYDKACDLDVDSSANALRTNLKARKRVLISTWHHGTDWLNKNHFDYRGLIPMGLALEAKEGMYGDKD